jgi:hypothetical protein
MVLINFRSLVGEIPQIRKYKVEVDIIGSDRSYNVVIDSDFDTLEDLKAYQQHPAHLFAVDQNKQWCKKKVIIDYEDK